MTNEEKLALKDFLIDIECLSQLDAWADDFNLFDMLKITNLEIRHSNILAWLFDPNENHGLGDSFIQSFITKVIQKSDPKKYNGLEILLQDFYSYQVYRESNNMDIVLLSYEEKTAIIIENKIWSGESTHQLNKYLEKSKEEYREFTNILYVFLTPDGIESSDPENWIIFSYSEIISSLESARKNHILRNEVTLVIDNYIEIVRKNIMREKDEELSRVCNEIYNKHKTALRLIFENTGIDRSIEKEIILETLEELSDDSLILLEDNNKTEFFTESMNDFLPALDAPNSSWGTNWVYYYWFTVTKDKLTIYLELGGWNLTDELENKMLALAEASKKNKRENFRYWRIYKKQMTLEQDNYEESLKNATISLVKSALENEKKLLTIATKEIKSI